jgi:hypothetical protein
MNRREAAYSTWLELRRGAGEIAGWAFQPFKLRLAPNTYYEPDFLIVLPSGEMELHDVKATWRGKRHAGKPGWEEDARVKIKAAATLHPWFAFAGVHQPRAGGAWEEERFEPGALPVLTPEGASVAPGAAARGVAPDLQAGALAEPPGRPGRRL